MPLIHVTGFPKEQAKLLVCFRNYFNGSRIKSKYWITEVADIKRSNLKEMTIDFECFDDALKAEEFMNNVPYVSRRGQAYDLVARMIDQYNNGPGNESDGYRVGRNHRSPSRGYGNDRYSPSSRYSASSRHSSSYSNNRDRSRSPLRDASKLDLEIELLRKKRLLIEEERKLIMEQKKLEMMKEFGPSVCAEFDVKKEFGEGSSTLFRADASREFERDQRKLNGLLKPQAKQEPAGRAVPPPEQRALANIPKFVLPCRIILGQMKKAIAKKAPALHERNILKKMITAILRRRFAIILENKSYMPSDAIGNLYRQVYPLSTDQELIAKTLKDVKACHWPVREKSQKTLEKMARRKAEKEKMRALKAGIVDNQSGTSANTLAPTHTVVNVKSEPSDYANVKSDAHTLAEVKTELSDLVQVKPELSTSFAEPGPSGDCEDWADDGVVWGDDDDFKGA